MIRSVLKVIGFAMLTAAFLWGFMVIQMQLRDQNYINGFVDGYNISKKECSGASFEADSRVILETSVYTRHTS